MPIRWDEINPNKGAQLIRPREIYASLQGRKWLRLRTEQNEVLEAWYDRRSEPDLVLKQNTGGGKTLTGLLIAQSSLHEGIGPAVFLVPDRFLIQQVVAEAKDAMIPVTIDETDESFRSSRAILVTTFHKLINGHSVFGVRGEKKTIPLGVVVIDDAHSVLNSTGGLFSASIPSSRRRAFDDLLALFATDLIKQSPKAFAEIREGGFGAPIRVPPKAVADRASDVLKVIQPYAKDPEIRTLFYSWTFVADSLKLATVTFTSRDVEIKTPCPDVSWIPAFRQAKRRVYLSATLEEEGILVTELDADVEAVQKPITPKQASDLGDRIILAPLSINPQLVDSAIHELARDIADGNRGEQANAEPVNVVVLVPSDHAAKRWDHVADETLHVSDMRPVIERMKNGEHVGIVVLVNKYDGVDLPGDACRLLILDGIPTPLTPHEQRASAALSGSRAFKAREVQKIEQGMGRGIRDVDDYCAVLILTSDAALTLRDQELRGFYSPATRAQIELSLQLADQIQGEGIGAITNLLDTFLQRKIEWVSRSLEATADVTYDATGNVTKIAAGRRKAFNLAVAGDMDGAVSVLRSAIDTVTDPLEKAWYLEELAAYQHHVDPVASQKTLAGARMKNPVVLKPAISPRGKRGKKVVGPKGQSRAAAKYLGEHYTDAHELELNVASLFEKIVWGAEQAADTSEEQFRLLGLHLGFGSSRPEKEDRDGGPDNLWALSDKQYAVIELKTGISRDNPVIIKSEAEQLTHSMTWFSERYSEVSTPISVLVHPSEELDAQAHVPFGTRVITETSLRSFRQDVEAFVKYLVSAGTWSDPEVVASALAQHSLTADLVLQQHSKSIRR
ncbi:DEAD/DEAH box helicase [Corynebacterium meridianum]|uniref:DEAD/DEAH box helicase n=1 Tax=Corynebacterium meridianum TaxID=2765363 RepID=A0A934I6D3_9CORY|nr:DEAD/DEAH box helicase [Corynebacterium meridianum]MBI8989177.1 DEAD/DEAH box helicase [Corynebacterium meridianum]